MKKNFLFLLSALLVAVLSLGFVSCQLFDDDDSDDVLKGTWVYTDSGSGGRIERTYRFNGKGSGHYKDVWENTGGRDLAPSYVDEYDFKYDISTLQHGNAGYVVIRGYTYDFSVSGSRLKLGSVTYMKK